MTIDRHHYKYIHIQSSNHKSGNDFKVKVPHGLNACTRVASQNFSIPNSIGNTYGPLSKLQTRSVGDGRALKDSRLGRKVTFFLRRRRFFFDDALDDDDDHAT